MTNPFFAALVAAGVACLATCMSAFANLTTFVGTRETKISEFRQNWITALRLAVIEFSAASRYTAATLAARKSDALLSADKEQKIMLELADTRKSLANSYHTVVLLLNSNEQDHILLKQRLKQVLHALKYFTSFADIQVKLELVEVAATLVFKQEWQVIKKGGETGQKWLSISRILLGCTFILGLLLIGFAFFIWSQPELKK